jgi:hypothetical protein
VVPDTYLCPGDTLILYGKVSTLAELDERRAGPVGDRCHEEARDEHRREVESATEAASAAQER